MDKGQEFNKIKKNKRGGEATMGRKRKEKNRIDVRSCKKPPLLKLTKKKKERKVFVDTRQIGKNGTVYILRKAARLPENICQASRCGC